jgi:hypothetical protein
VPFSVEILVPFSVAIFVYFLLQFLCIFCSNISASFCSNFGVFSFTYRYIDDVLSINNSRFAEFLLLIYQIYPPELEVKETTDTASSASFLDLYLEFDDSGQISTKIYDKWVNFNFKIINIFQICAAIYQLLLNMVFSSCNWFVMQGPVAIILISWNVIFIWETGYWTRAIKRFALFDLLKSLYSDTKILSKYIPSLQKRL